MKRYILIASTLMLAFTACNKELDILPQQSVAEELALNSDSKVKKVLNGAYDAISSASLLGGELQLFSELLAADGEIRWEGTFNQPREVWNKAILTTNSFVNSTWLSAYNAINISNNILSAIDVVNENDKDRIKGEALYIRGLMYFELVKLYAKPYSAGNASTNPGLPIVLEPTRAITEASYVARSTVEQTYTQILNDLTQAETLLPETNSVYAQKVAAAAMLSRVYLQMANYEGARDAADRAISYGKHTVVTPYGKAFNSSRLLESDNPTASPEDIYRIIVSAQDGSNSMHLYWSITRYGARAGDVSVLQKHLNFYDPADKRLTLFYTGAGNSVGGARPIRSGKWRFNYSNLPVVRLAEMYLTRAEANFRLGTSVGATPLQDINYIREKHAELPPLVTVNLANILLERKLELAHEGQGIHDVKRLKLSVDGFAFDANELVLPIPQREVNASNNVITQNAGY